MADKTLVPIVHTTFDAWRLVRALLKNGCLNIRPTDLLVLHALINETTWADVDDPRWQRMTAKVPIKALAELTLLNERTVMKAVRRLADRGLLQVIRETDTIGRQTANRYLVRFDTLAELLQSGAQTADGGVSKTAPRRVSESAPGRVSKTAPLSEVCMSEVEHSEVSPPYTPPAGGCDVLELEPPSATDPTARPDHQRVVDAWNAMAKANKLPTVQKLTTARRRKLKARIKEYKLTGVLEAMGRIPASPFLLGKNDRGWRANFDWLLRETTIARLLEGAFADSGGSNGSAKAPAPGTVINGLEVLDVKGEWWLAEDGKWHKGLNGQIVREQSPDEIERMLAR